MQLAIAALLVALAADDGALGAPAPTPGATASSGPTEPDPAARAGALFGEGRFAEAAAAFKEAYEATGDPAHLFGRAQALRRAGNCGAAIEVFEAFIAASPPAADVQAAQDVIAACREILGESAPELEPVPQPGPDPEPDPEPGPSSPRWIRDVPGGVLLGTGAAMTIVGGVLYGVAVSRTRDRKETEQGYEDRQRQVLTLGAVGIGVMVTGGALLVGSVVRYVLVERAERAGRGVQARVVHRAGPLRWRF